MSDFDILNAGNKKSFFSSLNKRKRLGYDDSESSDDDSTFSRHPKHIHENPNKKLPAKQESKAKKSTEQNLPKQELTEQLHKRTLRPTLHINDTPQTTNVELPTSFEKLQGQLESVTPMTIKEPKELSSPIKEQLVITSLSSDENDQESNSITDVGIDDLDPDLAIYLKEDNNKPVEPKKITIKLQYVTPEHATDSQYTAIIEKLLKPMKVIVMNDEQFDKILTIFCNHKKLKKAEVVLSYKEDKVFVRGTPAGLGMDGPETHLMYVYPIHTWDEKLIKEEQIKSELRSKLDQPEPSIGDEDTLLEEDNKMIIKLRGSDRKEISLRVKPVELLRGCW
ncbi:hypothetical protein BY458DRAFT_509753 [Sporodiniella umbellata]|nr:hypothetical protein BY458DRAFT_509753 [Sporodiniella umbellata]